MIIENLKQPSFKQNPPISFWDYKNFNKETFKTELSELDWSIVTANNETFLCFINKTLDKHAPIKTVKKRENKIISKPWITRGIKTSTTKRDKRKNVFACLFSIHNTISYYKRDKLYKQMIKAKNKQQKFIKHESYKKYRDKIIELIRQSKQTYYQHYFDQNKKD